MAPAENKTKCLSSVNHNIKNNSSSSITFADKVLPKRTIRKRFGEFEDLNE